MATSSRHETNKQTNKQTKWELYVNLYEQFCTGDEFVILYSILRNRVQNAIKLKLTFVKQAGIFTKEKNATIT